MSPVCPGITKQINHFKINFKDEKFMDEDKYLSGPSDYCSYWLTPPGTMEENEYINVLFDQMENVKVTIMIVKDDENGKIKY